MRETLKTDLPAHARRSASYLRQKLNELRAERPYITDVRGRGLLVGIEFDSDIAGDVLAKLIEEGVLVERAGRQRRCASCRRWC